MILLRRIATINITATMGMSTQFLIALSNTIKSSISYCLIEFPAFVLASLAYFSANGPAGLRPKKTVSNPFEFGANFNCSLAAMEKQRKELLKAIESDDRDVFFKYIDRIVCLICYYYFCNNNIIEIKKRTI